MPVLRRFFTEDKFLGDYDNVGLILRTHLGVYVCYCRNKISVQSYNEFISDRKKSLVKVKFKHLNKDDKEISMNLKFFDEVHQ